MGKKTKKGKAKPSNKLSSNNKYPFVSVCTPTFNRRPFIPGMLKCFNLQSYPKDRMEWIIVDDGTDKVGDLVEDHPNVKYFSYDVLIFPINFIQFFKTGKIDLSIDSSPNIPISSNKSDFIE